MKFGTATSFALLAIVAAATNVNAQEACSSEFGKNDTAVPIYCEQERTCATTGSYFANTFGGKVQTGPDDVKIKGYVEMICEEENTTCTIDCCGNDCVYDEDALSNKPAGAISAFRLAAPIAAGASIVISASLLFA